MRETGPRQKTPEQLELEARLSAVKGAYDTKSGGAWWYQANIERTLDFAQIFTYLKHTFTETSTGFRDKIYPVINQQVRFQKQLADVEKKLKNGNLTESDVSSLELAGKNVGKFQSKFQSAQRNERNDARAEFLGLVSTATSFTEPEPSVEPELTVEPKPKASADKQGPDTQTNADSDGKAQAQQEQQQQGNAGGSGSGGTGAGGNGGGNGGGGDDGDAGNSEPEEPKPEEEMGYESDFEFHPEMLKTVEGRSKVFREMVAMFNFIRKKRDALGFGSEVGEDGKETGPKRNMKNAEFDGYASFWKGYKNLREMLHEFSNRGVIRDKDGKIDAVHLEVDIPQEEMDAFTKQFGFFTSYFGRAERFGKVEPESEEEKGGQSQAEPEPEAEPTPEPEPQPQPTPEPEPEPQPEPTPEPEPQPTPEPEKNKFSMREGMRDSFLDFRAKKKAFMDAYEAHLAGGNGLKGAERARMKRNELPPELQQLETQFQEARRNYARTLDNEFGKRLKEESVLDNSVSNLDERVQGLKAMEAKHLLLRQLDARIELEKKYALEGRTERVFNKLTEGLRKHPRVFKALGAAAAIGTGALIGYLTAQTIRKVAGGSALGTLGTAAVVGGSVLGAAGGAWAGKAFADSRINARRNTFETSYSNASSVFHPLAIEAEEKRMLEEARKLNEAIKQKKVIVTAGAIGGGIAGGVLAGNVDVESIFEQVDAPDVEPLVTPEPVPEPVVAPKPEITPEPTPEPVIKPDPELTPLPDAEKNIDNFDKGDYKYEYGDDIDDSEPDEGEEVPEFLFTFEPGDKVNTVSEVLFESWKDNPDLVDGDVSKSEFLAEMYTAIAEIEKNPELNNDILNQMGIESGDIDKVYQGQTIDLQPFFEYMNNKH